MISKPNLDIFTGTSNSDLANEVAKILGMKISAADIGYFSDGEIKFAIPLVPKYKFKPSEVVAAKLNLAIFDLNSICTSQNLNLSVEAYSMLSLIHI